MFKDNKTKHRYAARLTEQLERCKRLRAKSTSEISVIERRRKLSEWQVGRLTRTYADLRALPRYRPAVDFFITDLYGPKDFSQRDHDMERVAPLMIKLLPGHAIETLALAIEMDALTQELDAALLPMLDADEEITESGYADAYRHCDNYDRRRHQIELVNILGQELDKVVVNPLIPTALLFARGPAHLAGVGELHDFLEHGLSAFRVMGGAKEFLSTIVGRETAILDRIYAEEPNPFDVGKEFVRD